MANYSNLSSLFTAIADAIRAKTGGTAAIVADNFPSEIAAIETGGSLVTVEGQISEYTGTIYFTNGSGEAEQVTANYNTVTFYPAKNTIFTCVPDMEYPMGAENMAITQGRTYYASGNFSIQDD